MVAVGIPLSLHMLNLFSAVIDKIVNVHLWLGTLFKTWSSTASLGKISPKFSIYIGKIVHLLFHVYLGVSHINNKHINNTNYVHCNAWNHNTFTNVRCSITSGMNYSYPVPWNTAQTWQVLYVIGHLLLNIQWNTQCDNKYEVIS